MVLKEDDPRGNTDQKGWMPVQMKNPA